MRGTPHSTSPTIQDAPDGYTICHTVASCCRHQVIPRCIPSSRHSARYSKLDALAANVERLRRPLEDCYLRHAGCPCCGGDAGDVEVRYRVQISPLYSQSGTLCARHAIVHSETRRLRMFARRCHSGSVGFTISEFAQEGPRDLTNGLRKNRSWSSEEWRRGGKRLQILGLQQLSTRGSNLAGRQGFSASLSRCVK